MSVVRNLVSGIVDYAGLFPPASLSLDKVAANFCHYLESQHAWMLARLILPVDQLQAFGRTDAFTRSDKIWRISALIPSVQAPGDGFEKALESIAQFNRKHAAANHGAAIVDSVEIKAATVQHVQATIAGMPGALNAFLEVPHHEDPTGLLESIANAGENIFAKIRTGGITNDLIPSPFEVTRFIFICANLKIGFKATAGLHHPLRGQFPLTYDQEPEMGTMFGFLNVFVAACLAYSNKVSTAVLEDILTESDAAAFEITDRTLTWREFEISASDILSIRTQKAISFGSCSFEEPTAELAQLGWLDGVESV